MNIPSEVKYLKERIAHGEAVLRLLQGRGESEAEGELLLQLEKLRLELAGLTQPYTRPENLAVPERETEDLEPSSSADLNFPKAQVEAAEAINEKFGITDPDHHRYNVLAWVRGYYQDRGENHGEHYEALKREQQQLGRILERKGIGRRW